MRCTNVAWLPLLECILERRVIHKPFFRNGLGCAPRVPVSHQLARFVLPHRITLRAVLLAQVLDSLPKTLRATLQAIRDTAASALDQIAASKEEHSRDAVEVQRPPIHQGFYEARYIGNGWQMPAMLLAYVRLKIYDRKEMLLGIKRLRMATFSEAVSLHFRPLRN
jgi:hypothetical protein